MSRLRRLPCILKSLASTLFGFQEWPVSACKTVPILKFDLCVFINIFFLGITLSSMPMDTFKVEKWANINESQPSAKLLNVPSCLMLTVKSKHNNFYFLQIRNQRLRKGLSSIIAQANVKAIIWTLINWPQLKVFSTLRLFTTFPYL